MDRSRTAALFVLSVAVTMTPFDAFAQPEEMKQQCAAAYETAQGARRDGKIRAARERALVCSQDACPGVIKKDCAQWLNEIESSIPTVVFEARDAAGVETTKVRVFFDGELLKEGLDGKAASVARDRYRLRFRHRRSSWKYRRGCTRT